MRNLLAFAFVALSALPLAAQQQQTQPLTVVAIFDVKPGKEPTFLNLTRKYYGPAFDKLMTDGTVLGWGIDRTVFHRRDEPGYDAWFSVPNYAAVEKALGAVEELRGKMTETDLRDWAAAVSYEHHSDMVMRDVISKHKPGAEGVMPYTMINTMRVKPGMEQEWLDLGKKHILPLYDKLMEEGAILSYSIMVEEEHSSAPGNRFVFISTPNLGARDKIAAAFRQFMESQPEAMKKLMSTVEDGSHRDETLKALIFKVKE